LRLNKNNEQTAEIEEITEQYNRIIHLLPDSTRDRVREIVHTWDGQSISSDGFDISILSDSVKTILENLADVDIEVIVALVMFELWQSEEEALSELLEEMHRINEAKQRQREHIKSLMKKKRESESTPSDSSIRGPSVKRLKPNPRLGTKVNDTRADYTETQKHPFLSKTAPPPPPDTLELPIDNLEEHQGKLDSLGEQSEMLSLRLQMTMDRRSKFISTLSNIMKKIATTQDTLIQNIK
jgi:hypothetical protein